MFEDLSGGCCEGTRSLTAQCAEGSVTGGRRHRGREGGGARGGRAPGSEGGALGVLAGQVPLEAEGKHLGQIQGPASRATVIGSRHPPPHAAPPPDRRHPPWNRRRRRHESLRKPPSLIPGRAGHRAVRAAPRRPVRRVPALSRRKAYFPYPLRPMGARQSLRRMGVRRRRSRGSGNRKAHSAAGTARPRGGQSSRALCGPGPRTGSRGRPRQTAGSKAARAGTRMGPDDGARRRNRKALIRQTLNR